MDYSIHDALGGRVRQGGVRHSPRLRGRLPRGGGRASTGAASRSTTCSSSSTTCRPGSRSPRGAQSRGGPRTPSGAPAAAVAEPFVSINADDYYGKQAFQALAADLARSSRCRRRRPDVRDGRLPDPGHALRARGGDARDLRGRRGGIPPGARRADEGRADPGRRALPRRGGNASRAHRRRGGLDEHLGLHPRGVRPTGGVT